MKDKPVYVFLRNMIGDLGGGQLYMARKSDYLRSRGWDVHAFYFTEKDVLIPELNVFSGNRIPELGMPFSIFSNRQRRRIAEFILRECGNPTSITIESYNFNSALWGEYIASVAGGKHVSFLLEEEYVGLTPQIEDFMRFKLSQKLLYGITDHNIPSIIPEASPEQTFLSAEGCCRVNILDYDCPALEKIRQADFSILTVTRLDKPYVVDMFREIVAFALGHPDKTIGFIILGDTADAERKKMLLSILSEAPNLKVSELGYVFPMPWKMFDVADVFVGCSGSALDANTTGLPVITVDANDFSAIGILSETTDNYLYRSSDEPPLRIRDLVEKIFSERISYRERHDRISSDGSRLRPTLDYSKHQAILDMDTPSHFWDTSQVRPRSMRDRAYSAAYSVLGSRLTDRLKNRRGKEGN